MQFLDVITDVKSNDSSTDPRLIALLDLDMTIKSNIALSYIAMLSVVGFFLWVICNFVRGLRQKSLAVSGASVASQELTPEKKRINWPVHIFLCKQDDIPIPGVLTHLSMIDAFMESSACLVTGQEISLYVDVPEQEQVRLSAKVIWAREGREGRNAAQLSFASRYAGVIKTLYGLA